MNRNFLTLALPGTGALSGATHARSREDEAATGASGGVAAVGVQPVEHGQQHCLLLIDKQMRVIGVYIYFIL